MNAPDLVIARARTDAQDRLVSADEPLAGLQRRCGGELPGMVAVPQLLEVVRKSRTLGLRLARTIEAFDGEETVRAWVEIAPDTGADADGVDGGCSIAVGAWQTAARAEPGEEELADRRREIDRGLAELVARLDPRQGVLAVEARAPDLAALARAMREEPARPWSEHRPLSRTLAPAAGPLAPARRRAVRDRRIAAWVDRHDRAARHAGAGQFGLRTATGRRCAAADSGAAPNSSAAAGAIVRP